MGSARYVEFGPPSTFFTEMANPLRICLLSEPYSMHVSSVRIWPLFVSISGLKWIAGAMVHGVTMHGVVYWSTYMRSTTRNFRIRL